MFPWGLLAFLPRRCACEFISISKINNTDLTREFFTVKSVLRVKLKYSAKETLQIEEIN